MAWALLDRKKPVKREASLTGFLEGVSRQTEFCFICGPAHWYIDVNTHRHTHADSKHYKCSSLHLVRLSTLPLTQHSSTNTHKHIRTHFHTYPQTDTNKRTHSPQSNGCQDKNNVANDLEKEKQRDGALCAYVRPDGKNWLGQVLMCGECEWCDWAEKDKVWRKCVDTLTTCRKRQPNCQHFFFLNWPWPVWWWR